MGRLNWNAAGQTIEDEVVNGVDADPIRLLHDTMYNHTGHKVEIWTGAGKTGTQLTETTDYTIGDEDTNLTTDAGNPVYQTITVTNSAYHEATLGGPLYVWYETVGDYVDAEDINQATNPPGMVAPFAMSTAPDGWLYCDGSAISRVTYAALFAAIGETWGAGDGSTTFNVPDLRGAVVRGTGSHGSETMANGSAYAGPAVGSFEDDQMQGHYHSMRDVDGALHNSLQVRQGAGSNSPVLAEAGTQAFAGTISVNAPTGDGTNGIPRTGGETRPFAAGLYYCIKT